MLINYSLPGAPTAMFTLAIGRYVLAGLTFGVLTRVGKRPTSYKAVDEGSVDALQH